MAKTPTHREPHWLDPIVDLYRKDVDRTILRANLKLTPDQRLANLEAVLRDLEEMRSAMKRAKAAAVQGSK